MNSFMKKYILAFCLMFLCSLSFANFSVTPTVINVSGVPGSSYQNAYLVTNKFETPMTFTVTLSNGNCFSENEGVDVNDWLKIEKMEFSLKPGETIKVPYEVTINEKMKGSLCGRVKFSVDQSSTINLSISVPIYVIVEGTENINFEIEDLDFAKNPADGNLFYRMTVKNTGNVHIRHTGKIKIYDSKKQKEIKSIDIEETVPTFCENSKQFVESIGTLDDGTYVAVFTIEDLGKQATKEIKFKVVKDEVGIVKGFWDKLKNKWKEFVKNFHS